MIGVLKKEVTNIDKDFFAIQNLNKLVNTTTNNCLFCNGVNPRFVLNVQTNMLQTSFSHTFNGILITDELPLVDELIHISYAKKKFLYIYHLDWMYLPNLNYSHLHKAFHNDNIDIIARNTQHARLIEDVFKKPKYIMNEWDYNVLIEIDSNE